MRVKTSLGSSAKNLMFSREAGLERTIMAVIEDGEGTHVSNVVVGSYEVNLT
jgi:hypothetical protein